MWLSLGLCVSPIYQPALSPSSLPWMISLEMTLTRWPVWTCSLSFPFLSDDSLLHPPVTTRDSWLFPEYTHHAPACPPLCSREYFHSGTSEISSFKASQVSSQRGPFPEELITAALSPPSSVCLFTLLLSHICAKSFFFNFLETRSSYVAQAGPQLETLLPWLFRFWD